MIGAGAALVAQNLSNGYFMLFFSPIVAAYVIFEITTRGLWRDAHVWSSVALTAAVVIVLTLPFFLPYLQLRRLGFPPRPLSEVATYSADVFSYWTAPPESHVWGRAMRAFPKPEGDLFPTLTALVLALIGLIGELCDRVGRKSRGLSTAMRGLKPIVYFLLAVCAVYAVLADVAPQRGSIRKHRTATDQRERYRTPVTHPGSDDCHSHWRFAAWTIVLARLAGNGEQPLRCWSRASRSCSLWARRSAAVAALIGEMGPYSFLYSHVPGFDGLRVPARYAMLVILFLAVTAGFGVAEIERRFARGWAVAAILGVLVVGESFAAPIIINGTAAEGGYAAPPPRVYTGDEAPPAYRFLRTLPSPGTVVVEFPFGEWGYEVRYMFYSTNHWHPLLNGYSGTFPLSYSLRGVLLRHPLDSPDLAWKSLMDDGATHAVVHGELFLDDEGDAIGKWLVERGARQIAGFGGDKVFALR